MGFDALLKRYFPGVVCALIALIAYFQASGMGQLVASSIGLDPSAIPSAAPAPKQPTAVAKNDDHTTSAAAILSRNPFDSVTGPLDGHNLELPTGGAAENRDPVDDPPCDSARVLLITSSDDPAWSFAAIAGADGKSQLRRQGDEVGSYRVDMIGWDRVWLIQGSSRCQAQMFNPKNAAVAKAPAPASSASPDAGKKGGKKVPQEIASKIHKISENQFEVERSVVDQILENQAELMRSARIVPEKEGDKVVGIRLYGIKQDSLLGLLGIENGDRLSSINGFEMTDPQKALEAYARLKTADHLTVNVNRRGSPVNIDFTIK